VIWTGSTLVSCYFKSDILVPCSIRPRHFGAQNSFFVTFLREKARAIHIHGQKYESYPPKLRFQIQPEKKKHKILCLQVHTESCFLEAES